MEQISHPLTINSYRRLCHHKGNIFVIHCKLQPASRKKKKTLCKDLSADVLQTAGFEKGVLVLCIFLFSYAAFKKM